jgi:hypothetical protein
MLDLPLDEIFKGLSVVEMSAYPIFTSLLKAFPPNHFVGVIQEVMMGGASGVVDEETNKRILEVADER